MCMHINSYCAHTLLQNCNVYVHTLKNIPQNINRTLAVHLTNSIMFLITGTPHRPYGDSLSEVLKVEENMKLRWIWNCQTVFSLPCAPPRYSLPRLFFSPTLPPSPSHTHLLTQPPPPSHALFVSCHLLQTATALRCSQGNKHFPSHSQCVPKVRLLSDRTLYAWTLHNMLHSVIKCTC